MRPQKCLLILSTDGQENATFEAKNTHPITAISKPVHANTKSGHATETGRDSYSLPSLPSFLSAYQHSAASVLPIRRKCQEWMRCTFHRHHRLRRELLHNYMILNVCVRNSKCRWEDRQSSGHSHTKTEPCTGWPIRSVQISRCHWFESCVLV